MAQKRKYSGKSHATLERQSRRNKAQKIIAVLKEFKDLKQCRILDIGTGSGDIAAALAKEAKSFVSVDMHDERLVKGYTFKRVKNEKLPFTKDSFDIVISNHVIEHVPKQEVHVQEIYRVLKSKGIAYIATPNKFWITDPHYRLPLLSWFPRKISSWYLKVVSKKQWDIYPLSYWSLKKLTKKFEVTHMTPKVMHEPKKFYVTKSKMLQKVLAFIPARVYGFFHDCMPSYILVLKKN